VLKIPEDIEIIYQKSQCLYSRKEVEAAFDKMANEITAELSEQNPIFLCAVVGGMIPLGILLTRLMFPLEINYIHATRYEGQTSGGELYWKAQPTCSLQDRTVIIIDDILDSGLTLSAIIKYCEQHGAKKVYTAVLVDKHRIRELEGLDKADFVGLTVGNHYVFGYGMDYRGYLRNAPGVYAVPPEYV
jgi:hypoxanthine phosphoribosyltransferase